MIGLPIGLIFAGYALGSWGWILVKGYNITLREWVSPLHPFTGPLDKAGKVPQGSIFPTTAKGGGQQGGGPVLRPGQTSQTGQGSGVPTESRF